MLNDLSGDQTLFPNTDTEFDLQRESASERSVDIPDFL